MVRIIQKKAVHARFQPCPISRDRPPVCDRTKLSHACTPSLLSVATTRFCCVYISPSALIVATDTLCAYSRIITLHMAAYIRNKKATLNFELLEEFEAGAVLAGYEVKSIRLGRGKLEGCHVIVRGREAFVVGISIAIYQEANTPKSYDPERARKLLLSRKELAKLETASQQAGLTIVPISWYSKGGKIKLSIAIARGKKKADKRETLKKRDAKREIERTLKNQ